MAGQADEADAPVAPRFRGGFQRAARAADDVDLAQVAQVVHLPQVEAVGAEPAQRIVEQAQRPIARALVRLRRQEDGVARAGAGGAERLAVVVLALLVGGRRVAVADARGAAPRG